MAIYLLLIVILCIGYLLGLSKTKRFSLIKATLLVGVETFIGSVLFFVILLVMTQTQVMSMLLSSVGSLFSIVLVIAIINGIILY